MINSTLFTKQLKVHILKFSTMVIFQTFDFEIIFIMEKLGRFLKSLKVLLLEDMNRVQVYLE